MKNLYLGLKTQAQTIQQAPGVPRFKYIGMWNNDLEHIKKGEHEFIRFPALLFEFQSTMQVDAVGNGVQVFDPLVIRAHILCDFYDAKDGTMSVNLDVFDLENFVYQAFQLYRVTGTDYGSSPLNRTGLELDNDHDNLYHCIPEYTTTWTDNSMSQPVGGHEIDPPLQVDIEVSKLEIVNTPQLTVNPTSLDFGNVTFGQSKTLTFTIAGTKLPDDVIMSTSYGVFQITWGTVFSNRIILNPNSEVLIETTITVKFTPPSVGLFDGHINYGVPGLNGEITLTGAGV